MKRSMQLYFSLIFLFILGSHRGYIALWTQPGSEPARVFPYSVDSLPDNDRDALEKGIIIEDEEELLRLLEDYLS